ncbi:MAG TPA: hypothetical protein VK468_04145, partial [Pyrinomonadaceae bacterium]|nr:hypothetical protein [Pyrinomonadaceae bacterium]
MSETREFHIDSDIRKARTLASEFYTDVRCFDLAKEKIFARTWHLIGTAGQVADLFPATILEGLLDEPV